MKLNLSSKFFLFDESNHLSYTDGHQGSHTNLVFSVPLTHEFLHVRRDGGIKEVALTWEVLGPRLPKEPHV